MKFRASNTFERPKALSRIDTGEVNCHEGITRCLNRNDTGALFLPGSLVNKFDPAIERDQLDSVDRVRFEKFVQSSKGNLINKVVIRPVYLWVF